MKRILCPNCYTYNRTTQFICTHCETAIHAEEEVVIERTGFNDHQKQLRRQHATEIKTFLKNNYYGEQAYYWDTVEPVATSEVYKSPLTYRFALGYFISVLASVILGAFYLWFTADKFQMTTTIIIVLLPPLFTFLGGTIKTLKVPCNITLEGHAITLGQTAVPWHKIHFMGVKKNDKTGLAKVQFEVWYGDDLTVNQMLLKDNEKTANFIQHLKQYAYKEQVTFAQLVTDGHVSTF